MPLLGNPTAAVLYPLKVIFALFPYAWGARLYIVAHTALAFVAMLVLMRSWGTSWTGSGLGALAYAFGAPILFQSATSSTWSERPGCRSGSTRSISGSGAAGDGR